MKMYLRSMIGTHDCQTVIARSFGLGNEKRECYVRAVPEPFYGGLFDRIRDAWSVVRGETFAIYWPKAGELEDAISVNSSQSKRAAQGDGHASDCSVHNEPAYPNGPCDCGAARTFDEVQWPRRRLSITFTHDTCGDGLFQPLIEAAAKEYFAAAPMAMAWFFDASNGVHVELTSHELLQWEKPQL